MTALCCNCHAAPRGSNGYCPACNRTYQRDYARRKRGSKPRPQPWRALAENEKYCGGCDRILDRSQFYKCRSKKDGLTSHCKRCNSFNQMRYQAKNRKRLRPLGRIRSAEFRAANPGYNSEAVRRYRKRKMLKKIEQALYGGGK